MFPATPGPSWSKVRKQNHDEQDPNKGGNISRVGLKAGIEGRHGKDPTQVFPEEVNLRRIFIIILSSIDVSPFVYENLNT